MIESFVKQSFNKVKKVRLKVLLVTDGLLRHSAYGVIPRNDYLLS